jgi:ribosomal protein S18 acetylase RimI-like enzyme
MSHALIVRPYAQDDYESVRRLSAVLDALHRERAPWIFKLPEREPRPREQLEQPMASGHGALLVAEAAGEVVGYVMVAIRDAAQLPVFVQQRWGLIDGLVVATDKRRSGVGTALLRAAEAWIENAGAKWVELNVYDVNVEARAFYAAAGYAPMIHRLRKAF